MTEEFRALAHKHLAFNTPLSRDHANALIERIRLAKGAEVLDLGCGWGELLLDILEANSTIAALGVDLDDRAIDRGRNNAAKRGLQDRVQFVCNNAMEAKGTFDLVLAIGVSHIWSDRNTALTFLKSRTKPNGRILFGDGFWKQEPSDEIRQIFGDLKDLAGLEFSIASSHLTVAYRDVANLEEWDEFEARWRQGLVESSDTEANQFALERMEEYENGYRGVLGFAYFILTPS
jgi:cyclopropane fatty-acyl-phospholipid synthase-like methyltransferase